MRCIREIQKSLLTDQSASGLYPDSKETSSLLTEVLKTSHKHFDLFHLYLGRICQCSVQIKPEQLKESISHTSITITSWYFLTESRWQGLFALFWDYFICREVALKECAAQFFLPASEVCSPLALRTPCLTPGSLPRHPILNPPSGFEKGHFVLTHLPPFTLGSWHGRSAKGSFSVFSLS